jgi:hypothetical protein
MARSIYDLRKGKNDQIYQVLKVASGHYRIFPLNSLEAIGEIRKRAWNDWYGELALDDVYASTCADTLDFAISDLERSIVERSEGKHAHVHRKDAAEYTTRLLERLKKGQ